MQYHVGWIKNQSILSIWQAAYQDDFANLRNYLGRAMQEDNSFERTPPGSSPFISPHSFRAFWSFNTVYNKLILLWFQRFWRQISSKKLGHGCYPTTTQLSSEVRGGVEGHSQSRTVPHHSPERDRVNFFQYSFWFDKDSIFVSKIILEWWPANNSLEGNLRFIFWVFFVV